MLACFDGAFLAGESGLASPPVEAKKPESKQYQLQIGDELLKPHLNYEPVLRPALERNLVRGLAHITGGGLVENIPRVLPDSCGVEIQKESWPSLPVFDVIQSIGDVDKNEMFRAFNMGVGMVFIVGSADVASVKDALKDLTEVYKIGFVVSGEKHVLVS